MLRNLSALVTAIILTGCATTATYPPTAGSGGVTATQPPLPQIMASALRYAQQRGNPNAALVFNLPPRSLQAAWDDIGKRLGDGARPMREGDKEAFTVRQVRLNGSQAEVDIVYPSPEGVYQLMTVHLEGAFGVDFRPMFTQRWLIPSKAQPFNPPLDGPFSEPGKDYGPAEMEDPVNPAGSAQAEQKDAPATAAPAEEPKAEPQVDPK
jgi:hypothetical protein